MTDATDTPTTPTAIVPNKKKWRPPTIGELSKAIRLADNRIISHRDKVNNAFSALMKEMRSMEKRRRDEREKDRIKIAELVSYSIRVESKRLSKSIVDASKKAEIAKNPDGALAAINLLAVESLFLLDRKCRNKGTGRPLVGLRKHLCAIEEATSATMGPSIRGDIYHKEGKENIDALIAVGNKSTDEEDED